MPETIQTPDAPELADNGQHGKGAEGSPTEGDADALTEETPSSRSGADADEPAPDREASQERTSATKGDGGRDPTRRPQVGYRPGQKSLQDDLETFFTTLAMFVSAADPFDGAVIQANAPRLARQLDWQARADDRLYAILSKITTAGTGPVALVMTFAPVVLPILHHHGLLPDHPMIAGVVDDLTPDEARQAEAIADETAEAVAEMFADAEAGE